MVYCRLIYLTAAFKYFAEFLSCTLNSFPMDIKQNACSQGFNTKSLLNMLLQMLNIHIEKWGFRFSLKCEFPISIGRISDGKVFLRPE